MYLHSPLKWWFVRQPKPNSVVDDACVDPLGRLKIVATPMAHAEPTTPVDSLELLASPAVARPLPPAAQAGAAPSLMPDVGALDGPAARLMLSPRQLGLDQPGLLEAYTAYFQRQKTERFAADFGTLTPRFFLDVQVVQNAEQASGLADALWGKQPEIDFFRDLAYEPLSRLTEQVEAAARSGGVTLPLGGTKKAAQLLQLHALEITRLELYEAMLNELHVRCRDCSTLFRQSQIDLARVWLDEANLGDFADYFLASPAELTDGEQPNGCEQAQEQFKEHLDQHAFWRGEILTLPSHRDPDRFYPPPQRYELFARPEMALASFESPPSFAELELPEFTRGQQVSNHQLFGSLSRRETWSVLQAPRDAAASTSTLAPDEAPLSTPKEDLFASRGHKH